MTQEEKELLFKDLCARLPYKVKVKSSRRTVVTALTLDIINDFYLGCDVKPYLRPLSSMTMEEKIELCTMAYAPDEMKTIEEKLHVIKTNAKYAADFYNEYHFDYRGLIPMGLALEAKEGMYEKK